MAKRCALSTGYLPRGGLPRNSVDGITDRPDMTSAVNRGRKASTQQNQITKWGHISFDHFQFWLRGQDLGSELLIASVA